jgi:hypothetical protein
MNTLRSALSLLFAVIATTSYAHTDTTSRPMLITPSTDETYRLSAVHGRGEGPAIKYMPEWEAFGWFTAEDSVVWEIDVKKSGNYQVLLTWSVSDEEAGKRFMFSIGSSTIDGVVQKSGSWETFKTVTIGTMNLQKGRQIAVFKPYEKFKGEALLDLREIRLVPRRVSSGDESGDTRSALAAR